METKVVHCKKDKFDVFIGRPSKWGNPFVIGRDGDRKNVLESYALWIRTSIGQDDSLLDQIKMELKGKVLGCYCAPDTCHGDTLAKLADSTESLRDV